MEILLMAFTALHVIISLVGIVTGFAFIYGISNQKWNTRLNLCFLVATWLTSITGFLFPVDRFLPSHALGLISMLILGLATAALYVFHLRAGWRLVYGFAAVLALYFNFFVFIVQLFLKVPVLHGLAPMQTEAPFVAVHGIALLLFGWLMVRVYRRLKYWKAS